MKWKINIILTCSGKARMPGMHGAFLREADLRGTIITPEQLNQAQSPDDIP